MNYLFYTLAVALLTQIDSGREQIKRFIITLLITLISCGGGDAPNANQAPKFISGTSYSTLDNVLETGYRSIAIDNDGDAITYSITGGVDELDFLIDPITGAVSFVLAPDFENPDDENILKIWKDYYSKLNKPLFC